MSITAVSNRIGFFTSSEIVALTTEGKVKGTWGKPALTYIEEKNFERKLGRSLDTEVDARPLSWGNLIESVLEISMEDYIFTSKETLVHDRIDNWSGSPDGFKRDDLKTVFDTKAPSTLKSFCQLVTPLYEKELHMTEVNGVWVYDGNKAMNWIRDNHKDGEKYYWQLVSNACLSGATHGELIVFCPYESEIPAIQHAANISGNPKYYFIANANKYELPYLKDDGYFSNLNIIRFEIPEEDKQKLEALVIKASEMLIKI